MSDFGSVLMAAFGIGLLIFVHEFGHFLAARWIGARVEVFSLGFGPRLCGFRRGDTDYRLSLVPLGGFVAVAGQDSTDMRHPAAQNLWHKGVGQRIVFYAGGVAMNLLFALVAFPLVFRAGVEFTAPIVGFVEPGGAAWEARLQTGDRVVAIDGKTLYSFENLGIEVALAGPRGALLTVRRGEQQFDARVLPQYEPGSGIYSLGIHAPVQDAVKLEVAADGAAAAAGLHSGDELLAVDGAPATPATLAAIDRTQTAGQGQALHVRVRRGGEAGELDVTVASKPAPSQPPLIGVLPLANTVRGLRDGLPLLADLDLRRGDRLLRIDGAPFTGLAAAAAGPARLALTVLRGGNTVELAVAATAADRQALAEHVALRADLDTLQLDPTPEGPALLAGVKVGDQIVAIDGVAVDGWTAMQKKVQSSVPGVALRCRLRRGDAELEVAVAPAARPAFDYGFGPLLSARTELFRKSGFGEALRAGTICSFDLVKQLYVQLKRMFTGEVAAKNLGSIIGISRATFYYAQNGAARFWYFLALLSLNLAVLNLLPIPILDGGYLLFLIIEKIKGSPVSGRVFAYSQVLGLIFVLALVVFATYNDIRRLI